MEWNDVKFHAKELDRVLRRFNDWVSTRSGELGSYITSLEMIQSEIYIKSPDASRRLGNIVDALKRLQRSLAVGSW